MFFVFFLLPSTIQSVHSHLLLYIHKLSAVGSLIGRFNLVFLYEIAVQERFYFGMTDVSKFQLAVSFESQFSFG
jgi:hypothetical protein